MVPLGETSEEQESIDFWDPPRYQKRILLKLDDSFLSLDAKTDRKLNEWFSHPGRVTPSLNWFKMKAENHKKDSIMGKLGLCGLTNVDFHQFPVDRADKVMEIHVPSGGVSFSGFTPFIGRKFTLANMDKMVYCMDKAVVTQLSSMKSVNLSDPSEYPKRILLKLDDSCLSFDAKTDRKINDGFTLAISPPGAGNYMVIGSFYAGDLVIYSPTLVHMHMRLHGRGSINKNMNLLPGWEEVAAVSASCFVSRSWRPRRAPEAVIQNNYDRIWNYDSACAITMTGNLALLEGIHDADPVVVTVANGQKMFSDKCGRVSGTINLSGVRHFEGAPNLISAGHLRKLGCRASLDEHGCTVRNEKGMVVGKGRFLDDGTTSLDLLGDSTLGSICSTCPWPWGHGGN